MRGVEPVKRLPNFDDLGDSILARRDAATVTLRRLFGLRGYERIETPILEQSELFVRKSGGELASRLYGFTEPGGYRVGLRPELTAPALRHVIETRPDGPWPVRCQYSGPVFRYALPEEGDAEKTRQFTQVGVEMIGSASPRADGEVIAAAIEGLGALGVPLPLAVIGHVGLFWELLKPFGLSDRARLFLVNSVGRLRSGQSGVDAVQADAERLGLVGDVKNDQSVSTGASLEEVAAVIDSTIGPTDPNAGVRTREEIVARLARKRLAAASPAAFADAFSLVSSLARVRGETREAIREARGIVQNAGQGAGAFSLIEQVVEAAIAEGVPADSMRIDFGLARGIAYYSGMVFDLHSSDVAEDSLGGGGRYDGLTRALGAGTDLPALGFAYNFEAVVAAMGSDETGDQPATVLVVASTPTAAVAAANEAARLRSEGKRALVDFGGVDGAAMRAAEQGASEIAVVDESGNVKVERTR